jgi:hypothetical protein
MPTIKEPKASAVAAASADPNAAAGLVGNRAVNNERLLLPMSVRMIFKLRL